jgi:hypothetical protein
MRRRSSTNIYPGANAVSIDGGTESLAQRDG